METVNGVSCIKGEIHSLVTLMRLHTRWSQKQRSGGSSSSSMSSSYGEENSILRSFRKLNEYLEGIFDLREVDCVVYLSPFHEVIVAENASGLLTSASLSSISKFVSYGFLCPTFPRVKEGIALIANCISRCVFEESDWESDEVILMKLLELSTLALRCDASSLLSVGAAWDMYSTCIGIHSQYRASKILRSEAETALRNLTLTTFSRAYNALSPPQPSATLPLSTTASAVVAPSGTGGGSSGSDTHIDTTTTIATVGQQPSSSSSFALGAPLLMGGPSRGTESSGGSGTAVHGTINKGKPPPTLLSWEKLSQAHSFEGPTGVALLLAKVMTVLSALMDMQTQTADCVKFALTLVNIALESGGPALGAIVPLVEVLRGDICRNLLRASQSDDLAVFSLALRVVFNLFVSIKGNDFSLLFL